MRRSQVTLVMVASCALTGCGAQWARNEALTQVAPEQQVQVWRRDGSEIWHAVHVDSEAVSGVPYYEPRTCEACRRTTPRSEVDSLRVGSLTRGFRNSFLLVYAVLGAIAWTFHGIGGN